MHIKCCILGNGQTTSWVVHTVCRGLREEGEACEKSSASVSQWGRLFIVPYVHEFYFVYSVYKGQANPTVVFLDVKKVANVWQE